VAVRTVNHEPVTYLRCFLLSRRPMPYALCEEETGKCRK
jgi:hypothetical protein